MPATGTLSSYVRVRYGADTLIRSGVAPSEAHSTARELNRLLAGKPVTTDELRVRLMTKVRRDK